MKDFTLKYTNQDEEKILLRKIYDCLQKSEKTYTAVYSHFLTPFEQTLIGMVDEFRGTICFEGGYEDAERRLCRISENEYCQDDGVPIKLYKVYAPQADFSHRDILGSLTGLGIKREMIGDIQASGDTAYFFCHQSVAIFVEANLRKIGKSHITLSESSSAVMAEPKTTDKSINVSSMRLDSVAAECFGLSRTKAAEYIKQGLVSVNWLVCTDTAKELKAGDKISLRGKGKARIGEISGVSKKGRLFVDIQIYI